MIDPGSSDRSVHARFRTGLARSPHRTALRIGDRSLTYTQLHQVALSWAGRIRDRLPVGRTARVAVLVGRDLEAYVAILATLYAGASVAPLLADFPAERNAVMIDDLAPDLVLLDPDGAASWPALHRAQPTMITGAVRPDDPPAPSALREPRRCDPDEVAYVLFTSGSTGRPKGVQLTHRNLGHYFACTDRWYDWGPADVFTQAANLNWDSSVSDVWSAWGAGGTLLPVPAPAYRHLSDFLTANGVTVWFSAPSVIALARQTGSLRPGGMPTLRQSIFGGEALRCSDAADWQAAAAGSAVINVYGPTETTITTHRHTWSGPRTRQHAINGVVPLGPAHPGLDERLVGPGGEPDPVQGELWIGGPQVAAGYLTATADAERFRPADGRRWYRTGDLVRRLPTGELAYLGRVDDQVQVQGHRVELADVEHAVRDVPGVSDAVVVGVAVDGSTELRVWYVAEDEITPFHFARRLRATLPEQLVPRWYRRLAEFPLNANRKIDRRRLGELAA